jgi:polyisoprenoid-binding protein YceI
VLELALSAGVHTCPCLHELGASAADMAQHLVQWTPPSHHSQIQVLITLGGLGKVTGGISDICCSFH